jgi:hypothetical protein
VGLGRARVTTQDVLRALVARLLADEALAARIRDDLDDGPGRDASSAVPR